MRGCFQCMRAPDEVSASCLPVSIKQWRHISLAFPVLVGGAPLSRVWILHSGALDKAEHECSHIRLRREAHRLAQA
ncbi:hypothetical protein QQF64_016808 [Cirrhinus molitorella]|uniref:Uncharacterized protein n=1 Tax=Cirrhinus molitorella TaxID=172907 RepID=A0ABR3LSB3_9TELE